MRSTEEESGTTAAAVPASATPDLTMPGVIHDLNNVFQTLVEAAHLLSEDPEWSPVSAAILRSIERGKEITLSLHAVDQPSASLETVLENAMTLVRDSMILRRGPNIEFVCDVETGLILRRAWAWERVLINLFFNAVHAMPQGGTITVLARQQNSRAEIVITDEGPGIDPELLASVFEPHVSTKVNGGLGLYIVQTIVKQEGGEVSARNTAGGGAEFTITLPSRSERTRTATA